MKKNYQTIEIQLVALDAADVIATSFSAINDEEIGVNANQIFG